MTIISRILRGLSIAAALSLSCSDHALIEKGIGPRALVYPEYIDFGHVNIPEELSEFGDTKRLESFVVFNTGDEDLSIQSMQLVDKTGNQNAFEIVSGDLETPIIPGDSREFLVEFEPENFESDGAIIEIFTDANGQTEGQITGDYLIVELEGYGDAPDILLDPSEIDFGAITVDCSTNQTISIQNNGNIDLVIYGIDQLNSTTFPGIFSVNYGSLPSFPWVIPAGQTVDFWIEFEAVEAFQGADSFLDLKVNSNDIDEPELWASIDGYNDLRIGHTETFVASEIPKADIVFVVDDSGSMHSHQANLSAQINAFMSVFASFGVDYHIGVITTTHSNMSQWIDSTEPDPVATVENMIMVGIQGSGMEQGLRTSWECFDTGSCGPNGNGFFRPDAQMVVIYISDEPDYSPLSWTQYESYFRTIKDPMLITMHGIIGDAPSGCNAHPYNAQNGRGYREMVQAFGGSEISICSSNWGVDLTNIATNISVPLLYQLSHANIVAHSVEVYVNGQLADSTRWTFNSIDNTVVFLATEAPEAGDTVSIDYEIASCQ